MTPDVRPLVAGNWKMNGTGESLDELRIIVNRPNSAIGEKIDALICVPATLVFRAAQSVEGEALAIGGEDCHAKKSGAHTGDISANMLKDAGASHVIVGHSERRTDHGETDAMVNAKAVAAWDAGLVAIICIGETEAQRKAGATLDIIATQLAGSIPDGATAANTVIAYEPVWAIGTGLTPTADDVREVHASIRAALTAQEVAFMNEAQRAAAHSLWRLGKTLQCGRASGHRERRWCTCWRRELESGGLPGHL